MISALAFRALLKGKCFGKNNAMLAALLPDYPVSHRFASTATPSQSEGELQKA